MENAKLAELLFPNIKENVEDLLKKYPPRKTAAFRFAPSPTGQLHIGGVGTALSAMRLARHFGGIVYLRIEDTDQKREVKGAVEQLKKDLGAFGIAFDEYDGKGKYGPYTQSKRGDIYKAFAKHLVEIGRAYPCFCTPDDLTKIRDAQNKKGERTGYNAKASRCQKLDLKKIEENLKKGMPWVLRFDSTPDAGQKIEWTDAVRGKMSLPTEENHFVVLKADGLPPYNFAHVVDDTLMRTSHILRGEEYIVSAPEHIQLARVFGQVPYQYAHIPVVCVLDNGSKRKLSKRKDKEALANTFIELGYPVEALIEYMGVLYNTENGFEKITTNNPLFDWDKLDSISREIIAKKTNKQINEEVQAFLKDKGKKYDAKSLSTLLAIGRETDKPRKDLAKYSDIFTVYDFLFEKPKGIIENQELYDEFKSVYNPNDDKETWLGKMKNLSVPIRDATKIISKATIGREQSPDLYSVLKIVGELHGLK